MLPQPLHPAVVHFPIVLVTLLPLVAVIALVVIRRGASPRKAWLVPVALAGALTLSAFVALRTGEAQEERVERVIPEAVLHEHEEAAERFLVLSGVLLAVATIGLLQGTVGKSARLVTAAGAFGLIIAGIQVGGGGGRLVYEHGAASAYVSPASGQGVVHSEADSRRGERDEPEKPEREGHGA